MIEIDEKYMRRALQLARQGGGHVSPNPMVGAVIVHDGHIIGEGFHRRCGQAHAEVNAVNRVADRSLLPASTLYVTLEPCSHHGKTPPCAQMLVDVGIGRVVVGMEDPYERVAGRGVELLRRACVQVTVGVLEPECRALNRRFVTAHTLRRPWVLLKWAQTADGFMSAPSGSKDNPLRISSPVTMRLVHRERALCDAIVAGARTVALDNPSLTTRLWPGDHALRVVLDRGLSAPSAARVFSDGHPTLVYNAVRQGRAGTVEWVMMDTSHPMPWLCDLYARGVTSVMVEGGAQVLRQMIDSGVWDTARVEVSPLVVGDGVPAPPCPPGTATTHRVGRNTIIMLENDVKKV